MGCNTNRLQPVLAVLGSLLAVFCLALPAQAVLKTTAASGDWNLGGNWSPAGVPVSGTDWVDVNAQMSVNTNTSFGDSSGSNASTMSGGNPYFIINGPNQLQHVAGSRLQITSGQPFISGTGTLLNSGTIENTSGRFLYLSGGTTINNAGAFKFMGTDSKVVMYDDTTPKFINNGTMEINMTASTNSALLWSENRIGGGVFTQQGSPITFTNGIFVFAPPGGIGGTMTDAAFAGHFGAIGATSELHLAGGVNLQLDPGVTNLSRVWLGDSAANILPKPGNSPTTINVSGVGIRTAPGNPIVNTGAALDTIINQGKIVVANNGGNFWINGNGKFINQGTMDVEVNRFLIGVSGNPTFQNQGTVRFTQNGARIDMWAGSPVINNVAGGQFVIDLPNATDSARIGAEGNNFDGGFKGEYHNLGGNAISFVKGTLAFGPPAGIGGVLNDAAFANLFGPINNSSWLNLTGGLSNITLTAATDVSRVRLGDQSQPLYVNPGNTVINVTSTGGIKTANGVSVINIPTGRTLTNLGTIVGTTGQQVYFYGDGSFENQGTLTVENNRFLIGVGQNPVVNNSGTVLFTENGSRIDLFGSTAANAFNNLATGIVRANLANGTDSSDIGRESGSGGTFTNLGTIEVLKGELVIESGITNTTAVTAGGTTLATGDWRVIANGARSRLNLQVGSTGVGTALPFDGTITTIASGVGLVLSNQAGGTVEFPQLGALQSVAGELFVHGTMNLPVDAAMIVTGTLGGNGIITTPGTISLNGGELDPSSLTGGPGTLTINGNLSLSNNTALSFSLDNPGIVGSNVNDLVVVNGNLTLDGVLDIDQLPNFGVGSYRLFNYTGTLFDNGVTLAYPNYSIDTSIAGQVNLLVLPVPEPSTGLLLLAGLVALRRRKRS